MIDKPNVEKEIQHLKSAVEELTLLNELALAASSSLDIKQTLDIIIQKSIKAIKAEQGSIMLVPEEQKMPLVTLIRQADVSHSFKSYKIGDHIVGWVLKYRQPLIIENLATDKRFNVSEQEIKDIRSVLCVPILFAGKIIAIMIMANKKIAEPFNSDDLRLLSILATQSGQLIRNSQLQEEAIEKKRLENELQIARQIQLSLLPKDNPKIKQLDMASHFEPFQAVGGDYYDYFYLADNMLGLVIADVSGHGPSAAMVMTMIKGMMHSLIQHFNTPDTILTELNTSLFGLIPRHVFISMTFFVIDPIKNVIKFSNAGHVPFIYYDQRQDSCRLIELRGCALNLSRTSIYSVHEMPLQSGDIFLIYTDGVSETCNAVAELFGYDRLVKTVFELKDQSAQMINTSIRAKLHDFSNQVAPGDDMILITIKIQK